MIIPFDDADEEIEEDGHGEEIDDIFEAPNIDGASEFADLRLEPWRFAIFEDNVEAPTLDMNLATAETTATYERLLRESIDEITRGAIVEATRGAITTDDGEEHG